MLLFNSIHAVIKIQLPTACKSLTEPKLHKAHRPSQQAGMAEPHPNACRTHTARSPALPVFIPLKHLTPNSLLSKDDASTKQALGFPNKQSI